MANVLRMQGKLCRAGGCSAERTASGYCLRCEQEIEALNAMAGAATASSAGDAAELAYRRGLHDGAVRGAQIGARMGFDSGREFAAKASPATPPKTLADRLFWFSMIALGLWLANSLMVWLAHNVAAMEWGK